MSDPFRLAIDFTLRWEGGYSFDPDDLGGETNFGISKKSYPDLDIKALTREQAEKIYLYDYWLAVGCDGLTTPVAVAMFDTAVNIGVGRVRTIQASSKTWQQILHARMDHYVSLCHRNAAMIKFFGGWMARTSDLWKLCSRL
jgi:lysozyme family protein